MTLTPGDIASRGHKAASVIRLLVSALNQCQYGQVYGAMEHIEKAIEQVPIALARGISEDLEAEAFKTVAVPSSSSDGGDDGN